MDLADNVALSKTAPHMESCVQECLSCHSICESTLAYCLKQGGKHSDAEHLRTLADCAEICQTSANFMLRGSELHVRTCAACAAVCEKCAELCEAMQGDAVMQACAAACRRCAASCRKMSAGV